MNSERLAPLTGTLCPQTALEGVNLPAQHETNEARIKPRRWLALHPAFMASAPVRNITGGTLTITIRWRGMTDGELPNLRSRTMAEGDSNAC